MEQTLTKLGLSQKEAKFYLYLLKEGDQTAAQIAKALKESRTNTYMILEQLIAQDLVIADDTTPIRTFSAADPAKLKAKIESQQQQLKQSQTSLNSALPQLTSMFSLGNHKPGVVYFQGLAGFKLLNEDIAKAKSTINIIASEAAPTNKEAWEVLLKATAKRKARGMKARAIFHQDAKNWPHIGDIAARGLELRFWGSQPLAGEMILYDNKIALIVYDSTLVVTVITNEILAQTFESLFADMWSQASII